MFYTASKFQRAERWSGTGKKARNIPACRDHLWGRVETENEINWLHFFLSGFISCSLFSLPVETDHYFFSKSPAEKTTVSTAPAAAAAAAAVVAAAVARCNNEWSSGWGRKKREDLGPACSLWTQLSWVFFTKKSCEQHYFFFV